MVNPIVENLEVNHAGYEEKDQDHGSYDELSLDLENNVSKVPNAKNHQKKPQREGKLTKKPSCSRFSPIPSLKGQVGKPRNQKMLLSPVLENL